MSITVILPLFQYVARSSVHSWTPDFGVNVEFFLLELGCDESLYNSVAEKYTISPSNCLPRIDYIVTTHITVLYVPDLDDFTTVSLHPDGHELTPSAVKSKEGTCEYTLCVTNL